MRWDLIIPVIGMYVLVALLTSYALRKVKTDVDYMLAGRNLGYGLIIPHIVGAFFGAGSTIGVTSLAYIWGMGGAWYNMAEALGLWILMTYLARRLWHLGRRLDFVTLPDLLQVYYGNKFKSITGLFIALGYLSWVAGQIVGGGRLFEQITGFPLIYSIIICTLLVGFYAGFGGLWGSVFADLIFGSLTVIGALVVAPILIHQYGGWASIMSKVPATYSSFFWLGEKKPLVGGLYGWTSLKNIIWYILVFTPAFAIGQLNIQRIYACKSEKVAHGMSTFIASYVFFQPIFFAVIGVIAFALNPKLPARDAAGPWLMVNGMSVAVGALFLCSLIATIMSCAAGGMNTAVASLVRDIWKPLVNPKVNELKLGRIMSLLLTILSLIFAIALPDVVGWLSLGFSLMGVSLFIPTLALIINKGKPSKWANSSGAVWSSLIGGGVVILWKALTVMYGQPFAAWDPIFAGLPVALILFPSISYMTSGSKTAATEVAAASEKLQVLQEILTTVKPNWSFEGKGTLIFILTAIASIFIIPKLFYLF